VLKARFYCWSCSATGSEIRLIDVHGSNCQKISGLVGKLNGINDVVDELLLVMGAVLFYRVKFGYIHCGRE